MLLLVTKSLPEIQRIGDPMLGRLFQPRHVNAVGPTVAAGVSWAADNDGYGGFKVGPWLRMMSLLAGKPGCLFATAPDVVADWPATKMLWDIYWPVIHECDLPAAVVLQDGCMEVPAEADAVFVGGSTEWKLSDAARRLVVQAKERGLWVHMGRVNSQRRLRLAASWDCDSVDGSGWARFFDTHIAMGLTFAASQQMALPMSGGKEPDRPCLYEPMVGLPHCEKPYGHAGPHIITTPDERKAERDSTEH